MSVRTIFTGQGGHPSVGHHSTIPSSARPCVAANITTPVQTTRYIIISCVQPLQKSSSIQF